MSGKDYFNQALSDFMFEAASGGAIRHLSDLGYSVDQIMGKLAFPTPRDRVEKAVYRHLSESGILRESLPAEPEQMRSTTLSAAHIDRISARFLSLIDENGEENAYLECHFGAFERREPARWEELLACLNSREREYISGIRWQRDIMYHRLNGRMREIAEKLVIYGGYEIRCWFLQSREILVVHKP